MSELLPDPGEDLNIATLARALRDRSERVWLLVSHEEWNGRQRAAIEEEARALVHASEMLLYHTKNRDTDSLKGEVAKWKSRQS